MFLINTPLTFCSKMTDFDFNPVSSRSFFAVGDDAQTIYSFRGSNVDLILNFHEFYPNVKEIVLNQNYRSTQPILDLAEDVLSHNSNQKKKELFTANKEDKLQVRYFMARNEKQEAEYIVKQIYETYVKKSAGTQSSIKKAEKASEVTFVSEEKQYKATTNSNNPISSMFDLYLSEDDISSKAVGSSLWGEVDEYKRWEPTVWQAPIIDWSGVKGLDDCAILYRTHAQSRSIEEALLKNKVPYRLVSGTRFLDRREVKDVLSILRYLSNPQDTLSLSRFLPLLLEGVGPKTLDKVIAFLQDRNYPLPPKHQEQVDTLLHKMYMIFDSSTSLIKAVEEILQEIGYLEYLKKEFPKKDEYLGRLENIKEISSLILPFDEQKELSMTDRLEQFIAQLTLMSSLEQNDEADNTPKVNLMTLHQSKGLEFETVFLVGVEDGILPHSNSLADSREMEEEVRLAYVGVTRAKKHLHLIAADSRILFGMVRSFPVSRIFRPFLNKHCKRMSF
jgi:superfamily I DNA/RNA helicase